MTAPSTSRSSGEDHGWRARGRRWTWSGRGRRRVGDLDWLGESIGRTTAELAVYVFQGEATAAHDLVVTHRGPGRERLLGGTSSDAAATPWRSSVHPEDQAMHRTAESYAQLRKAKPIAVEIRLVGLDGRVRWVNEHLVPRWERGRLLVDGIVTDVTEQRLARIEAEQARRRLEAVMRRADTYVWVAEVEADGAMRDVYSVSGIERLLGGSLAAGVDAQTAWRAAVHADDLARFDAALEGASRGDPFDIEYRLVGHDQLTRIVRDQATVTLLGGGRFRIEGLIQDVTAKHDQRRTLAAALAMAEDRAIEVEQLLAEASALHARAEAAKQAAEDHARRLAEAHVELELIGQRDSLTGITNRRHATELIEQALATGAPVGIAMLDVDHFKSVNDTYGHAGGDDVLVEVARRLAAVRAEDLVSRWGGEEFCVLLTSVVDDESLLAAAERLRSVVESTPFVLDDGPRIDVTVSIGVSRSGDADTNIDRLVGAADEALYRAKRGGRNQVRIASAMPAAARSRTGRP